MEAGSIVPTLLRLRQLSAVYGCSMGALICRTSDRAPDIANWLAKAIDGLCDADRVVVIQQTAQLAQHLKSSTRRRK